MLTNIEQHIRKITLEMYQVSESKLKTKHQILQTEFILEKTETKLVKMKYLVLAFCILISNISTVKITIEKVKVTDTEVFQF